MGATSLAGGPSVHAFTTNALTFYYATTKMSITKMSKIIARKRTVSLDHKDPPYPHPRIPPLNPDPFPVHSYLHSPLKKSPRLRSAPGRVTPPTRSRCQKRFLGPPLPILPWVFLAIGCRVFLGVASWVFGLSAVRPFVLDKPAGDRVPDFPQGQGAPPWLAQSNPPAALQPGRPATPGAPFSPWSCPRLWASVSCGECASAPQAFPKRKLPGRAHDHRFLGPIRPEVTRFARQYTEPRGSGVPWVGEWNWPKPWPYGQRSRTFLHSVAEHHGWSRVKAG